MCYFKPQLVWLWAFLLLTSFRLRAGAPETRYQRIFTDVLSRLHLDTAKIHLKAVEELSSIAQADSVPDGYEISYDRNYFDGFPDVIFTGILCHELGHVQAHHFGPTDKNKETAADIACGSFMRQLAYQRVEDAYEFLKTAPSGNQFYPSKQIRKDLIAKGWNLANPLSTVTDYVAFSPIVTWQALKDTLMVNINDRVIKDCDLGLYTYGIFYDSTSFTTYQLDNFSRRIGSIGPGRMVNNRTTLVYRRVGRHSFFLYDKGEVIEKTDCHSDEGGYYINGHNDLVITCYSKLENANVTYILKMYGLAPKNYLFPVYKN